MYAENSHTIFRDVGIQRIIKTGKEEKIPGASTNFAMFTVL